MNVPTKTVDHDPETGEIRAGLPAAYEQGNQSLAVQLAMAELNQDVVTAKSFPRSVARVMRNITELVMLDEQTAKECVYAVPRDGKTIRGPSIRLAEIIASQWGNCHCASRVVHVDRIEKYAESEGIFHDLETGLKRTARTRKPIAKRDGGIYSLDMINTAGNAAASIGMREAILKGVPKAVWRPAYEHAEKVIRGDVATLAERRDRTMKSLLGLGVTPERVFAAINVGGLEEIGIDQLADLYAMYQGVKNGDANVDEAFPAPKQLGNGKPADLKSRLNDLAGDEDDQKPAAKQPSKKSAASPSDSDGGKSPLKDKAADEEASSGSKGPGPDDVDPVAKARRDGAEARAKGMSRKALPKEYRNDEPLMSAYLDGFDTGEAEDREPGADEEE